VAPHDIVIRAQQKAGIVTGTREHRAVVRAKRAATDDRNLHGREKALTDPEETGRSVSSWSRSAGDKATGG